MTPSGWRDHRDRPTDVPEPPDSGAGSHYAQIGDFQGRDYARNAFAAGTTAEVDALVARLGLLPSMGVLDIGCGDGRHLREMARRGLGGLGIDVSEELVLSAKAAAAAEGLDTVDFLAADAREFLAGFADAPPPFDVGLSLCQGAFGTSRLTDVAVMHGLARHLRPGGVIALTAFHTLFAARHLVEGDAFDPMTSRHHHVAEVHGPDGARRRWDLWTTSWTVPELVALAHQAGLDVLEVVGCEPGRYDGVGVGLDDPELLLVARRPR